MPKDCAQACTQCTDACLGEPSIVALTPCITRNLDCADICTAAARIGARQTGSSSELTTTVLAACASVCQECAEECERYSSHQPHCRVCAGECRRCAQACDRLINQLN
ncbi:MULTISPECIES: four-helix bundle copper-binding protein [Mycolicibacterium]|uniref:four-helix bundle copper-binding protein n=1 Tax=Mycolicibacterium TaxID=1866885 RepID=UPI0035A8E406